ncbi:MAG TPA: hypothetical protein VKU39_11550 [Streptosporangiaceae bacterium]|nr:hypothetical protein [Streptosporangiaceae bacterium]
MPVPRGGVDLGGALDVKLVEDRSRPELLDSVTAPIQIASGQVDGAGIR